MEVPLHLPSLPLYAAQQLLKRNKIFYLIFICLFGCTGLSCAGAIFGAARELLVASFEI